ncbi:aminoglycoside phosphotransferase [Skermanella stibiiresistens SB22]|uniref:Aminoglycoside phosphotransferase n=1 Tax=Skermanella stibiiresistens SB22 TaxID=1385369 RepID=W9H1H7_9PROT|nr:phosphotransferase [Skermanella stibiiresistens]EWY38572.1 aminoglycoside phosphotransferase [Skermanella stibiiresistens SB22]
MKSLGSPADTQERLAESALARWDAFDAERGRYGVAVPGAASPSYHGVESASYLVAPDGGDPAYLLKVTVAEISGLIDQAASLAAARTIHGLGLAPKPVAAFPEQGAILFELLGEGWRAARIDDLRSGGNPARLVEMQRSIGAGPALARDWSVFDGIGDLRGVLATTKVRLPDDASRLFATVDSIGSALAASGIDLRPAHGDPQSSNVMIGPVGALRLVDFDMAANVDPYYQLGILMNELCQFDDEMKPLLEMHEGRFDDPLFARCRLYAAADDLYWALRSLVLDQLSPRRSLEFLKFAEWRLLRCRSLVGRPDFEGLIRSI